MTIDRQAEQLVQDAAASLTTPREGECLLCFVARMLDEFGCDCSLRFASRYRDLRAPRATALERRLEEVGGFCDCEIFLNGYVLAYRAQTWDEEVALFDTPPTCLRVPLASTRPCAVWQQRRE